MKTIRFYKVKPVTQSVERTSHRVRVVLIGFVRTSRKIHVSSVVFDRTKLARRAFRTDHSTTTTTVSNVRRSHAASTTRTRTVYRRPRETSEILGNRVTAERVTALPVCFCLPRETKCDPHQVGGRRSIAGYEKPCSLLTGRSSSVPSTQSSTMSRPAVTDQSGNATTYARARTYAFIRRGNAHDRRGAHTHAHVRQDAHTHAHFRDDARTHISSTIHARTHRPTRTHARTHRPARTHARTRRPARTHARTFAL